MTTELTERLREQGSFTREEVYAFFQKEQRLPHAEASMAVDNYLRDLRNLGAIVYEGHRVGWRFIS